MVNSCWCRLEESAEASGLMACRNSGSVPLCLPGHSLCLRSTTTKGRGTLPFPSLQAPARSAVGGSELVYPSPRPSLDTQNRFLDTQNRSLDLQNCPLDTQECSLDTQKCSPAGNLPRLDILDSRGRRRSEAACISGTAVSAVTRGRHCESERRKLSSLDLSLHRWSRSYRRMGAQKGHQAGVANGGVTIDMSA